MTKLIIALAPLALVVGCSTVPPPVDVYTSAQPQNAARINHVSFRQVALEDFRADTVMVRDIRRSRTADNLERVQVFVKNLTEIDQRVKYRFNWEDANGVDIVDYNHDTWIKDTIQRGDEKVFTSLAPQEDCKDFKLRLKPIVSK